MQDVIHRGLGCTVLKDTDPASWRCLHHTWSTMAYVYNSRGEFVYQLSISIIIITYSVDYMGNINQYTNLGFASVCIQVYISHIINWLGYIIGLYFPYNQLSTLYYAYTELIYKLPSPHKGRDWLDESSFHQPVRSKYIQDYHRLCAVHAVQYMYHHPSHTLCDFSLVLVTPEVTAMRQVSS